MSCMSCRSAGVLVLCAALAPAAAKAAAIEARLRDAAGRPVPDAVVYATPVAGPQELRAARTVTVEQADREFVPYVSVIQTGTAVAFPNRDSILHHVYSFSPAKTFEFKLYTGKSPGEVRFDKPGVVTVGCNIHDWMIAYIVVVSTPYYARSGESGVASLRDLPPGRYELQVWHPGLRAMPEAASVNLDSASARHRAEYMLDVAPRKPRYKPPLDLLKY